MCVWEVCEKVAGRMEMVVVCACVFVCVRLYLQSHLLHILQSDMHPLILGLVPYRQVEMMAWHIRVRARVLLAHLVKQLIGSRSVGIEATRRLRRAACKISKLRRAQTATRSDGHLALHGGERTAGALFMKVFEIITRQKSGLDEVNPF